MVWERDKENWASGNALVLKDEVQRAKKKDKSTYVHAHWGSLSYLSLVFLDAPANCPQHARSR
jgi:hypothetical protein